MYASYGRQEFPGSHVPEEDAYGNPRWQKGFDPDFGVAAGIAQVGRDDREPRPAMKVFPQAAKGDFSFDGMGTQPVWMTELQDQQGRTADSRMSDNMQQQPTAGGRQLTGKGTTSEEQEPRGQRQFPNRDVDRNVLGRTDGQYALPQPQRSAPQSVRSTPTGHDRHLANFQSQLQEDIYQRFRHIKDAFLAMDPDRKGLVDREAVIRLCTIANLSPESAGTLISCFDRSGTTVWDFNEFVAALRRDEYDDDAPDRRGIAGLGPYVPESPAPAPIERGDLNAAALVNPGERVRSKIPRDLHGRELQKKPERSYTGAGMRVEHAASYEAPQLRARILAVAFARMDKQNAGRVGRGALMTWAASLPRDLSFKEKLQFDQAFEKMLEFTDRQPDKRIALHDVVAFTDGLPPSVLGGVEAALTPPPSAQPPSSAQPPWAADDPHQAHPQSTLHQNPSAYNRAEQAPDQPHYAQGQHAGPPPESRNSGTPTSARFGRRAVGESPNR